MDSEFCLWLCYVKLLVCDSDKNSCQCNLVYHSVPAKKYIDLIGFQNERLIIIAIFYFHPINRCVLAEIDESQQKKSSIKFLMVEDNLLNFRIWCTWSKFLNLVAYYGFDVETVIHIAANKQVDIIIVNPTYSGKYKEVNWMENIRALKSNSKTASIPVILKLSAAIMANDEEKYLAESGADDAILVHPGNMNPLLEKIQQTLSRDSFNQNTKISSKNKVSHHPSVKTPKEQEAEENLERSALEIYFVLAAIGLSTYFLREFLRARINSSVSFIREFFKKHNPFKKNHD